MMRALWTAATGMLAQQLQVDTISNNLSNVNTTGYKKGRVDFQDLLYHTVREAGTPTALGAQIPVGIQIGHGTRSIAIQKMFSQGSLMQTENQLDIAIEGEGFFQILQPDGTIAYSRDGSFKKDVTGRVVTSQGFALEPEIVIPQEALALTISEDGTVSVILPGQPIPAQIGQLTLTRFINPAGLSAMGKNLFSTTAASGDPVVGTPGLEGFGPVVQGFLEMSNVKVVEEMVNLIIAQRAYEANSRAIKTSDDMLSEANNLRR